MWAVVEISSKQYIAKKGDTLKVERLKDKEGEVLLDKVLLLADDNNVRVGTPYLDNVKVKANVIEEKKGKKVLIYKYRRRKKSRRKRGHRQIHTILKISDIVTSTP